MSLQRLPSSSFLNLPASLRPLLLLPQIQLQRQQRYLTNTARSPFQFTSPSDAATASSRSPSHPGSVSAEEVSHFSALASSWWDPHGPSRLLHLMNPLRHSFIASCLAASPHAPTERRRNSPANSHYLDVGCGGGIFVESVARKVVYGTGTVTGVDPSREVLAIASKHARRDPSLIQLMRDERLRYLCAGVEDLPLAARLDGMNRVQRTRGQPLGESDLLEGNKMTTDTASDRQSMTPPEGGYDIVSLFEVLEHVNSPSDFLETLIPHVRPGGWLVLSTISRTLMSWFTTKLVAEDLLRIVPRGTHEWNKYVNEEEIRAWFQDGGRRGKWESARSMGVVYVPGLGWREVPGSENIGNYFFGVRRRDA